MAVTESAVCYSHAEHEDQYWDYDRNTLGARVEDLSPRALVAWRRPLSQVTEVSLGDDVRQWLPRPGDDELSLTISYALKFGDESIEVPLRNKYRHNAPPNPDVVVARISDAWRLNSR